MPACDGGRDHTEPLTRRDLAPIRLVGALVAIMALATVAIVWFGLL